MGATLKIADFTFARFVDNPADLVHSVVGTPYFMAPEIIRGEYNHKSEMWSVGAILFQMLTGDLPWRGSTLGTVFRNKRRPLEWPLDIDVSDEMKDLVGSLLKMNPDFRISGTEFFSLMKKVPDPTPPDSEEENDMATYSFEISQLQQQLSLLKRQLLKQDSEIEQLQTCLEEKDRSVKQLGTALDRIKEENERISKQNKDLEQNNLSLENTVDKLKLEKEQLTQTLEKTQSELASARTVLKLVIEGGAPLLKRYRSHSTSTQGRDNSNNTDPSTETEQNT